MGLMPEKLKNVLLFVSKTALKTIITMPLHPGETKFHIWNIVHQLPQRVCCYIVWIKMIPVITTGSVVAFSTNLTATNSPARPTESSSWVSCRASASLREKPDRAANTDRLAVISVRVCVMISPAHPGSVLIDLLNAEIDCREAEQPYWSAAFIIHSVLGVRRGERRGPGRRRSYWLDDLIAYWLDEHLPDKVTDDLPGLMTDWTRLWAWMSDLQWLMERLTSWLDFFFVSVLSDGFQTVLT